jgi:hypothetical protein
MSFYRLKAYQQLIKMTDEPMIRLIGFRLKVWQALKNAKKWMTIDDLAQATNFAPNTVQAAITVVSLDPRVIRRTGIRDGKRVVEYAFVPLIDQIFEG